MQPTDIINISLASITALTAVISIIIAVITLRQNSKMIEESTRPNIVIYSSRIDGISYFIVKNYGSSYAIIDKIFCNHQFTLEETGASEGSIFDKISNSIIAPNQSIRCPIIAHALKSFDFKFVINYHSSTKSYEDSFEFNIINNDPFATMNASKVDEITALQNIYITLLEMLKHKL